MFKHIFEEPGFFGMRERSPAHSIVVTHASSLPTKKDLLLEREAKLRQLQKRLSLARVQGNKHLAAEIEKDIKKMTPAMARYRPM